MSDAVVKGSESLTQETPNQPDPPPKSDPEIAPPAVHNPDPGYHSPDEEEEDDEDGEEIEQGQKRETTSGIPLHIDPPITDPHDSVSDVTLTSPSGDPSTRRGGTKRKKGKGRGSKAKGKKLQVIQEKFQSLMKNLNPIPFIPTRILDFANHEKLLTKLGLWEFVHIDFDRTIRVDLIAQLVASYNPKLRASYVNDCRIMVNRADLARAFRLPLKKEKGNVGGVEVDLEWEDLSDDSIGFLDDVLTGWMLFHEELWETPAEVMELMKLIKEGHPEKVDWAGLLWLMVEKELKQAGGLRDCYYASHLQHLIKHQRADLLLAVEPDVEEVDGGEVKEEKEMSVDNIAVVGVIDPPKEEGLALGGPSTELTLGQESDNGEKEEGMKEVEMNDAEECNGNDEEGGGEEQGHLILNGKNEEGEHFMQSCGAENGEEFGSFEDRKDEEEEEMDGGEEDEEEEEEEAGDGEFHGFPNDALEGDGFTLQMGANHVDFGSQDDARVDMQHTSFFTNSGKRVIEHDNHMSHGDDKRLRINDSWDNKPLDFGMCMDQIHQVMERARMLYAEKEQGVVESSMNQQLLLNEVQKRDEVIEHLQKSRLEEVQKKDREIYRLERELYLMGSVLDGYRKALKDVKKAFGEYKERAKLPEEPTYKDVGDGGLMLTGPELERLRKKREEDYKMSCLIIEAKVKEVEENLARQFDGCVDKVKHFDTRLLSLEAEAKTLTETYALRKLAPTKPIEEQGAVEETVMMDVSESQTSLKLEEKENVAEEQVYVAPSSPKPEENVADEDRMELSKAQASPKPEEEVDQVSESGKTPEAEGAAEDTSVPQTEEKGAEVEASQNE